ncbi:MAG TPA: hypothetical protein VH415_04390 [Nitrososphaeraceae archaeon]
MTSESSNSISDVKCPICESTMIPIQACHVRCQNCGAELTCSDKGSYW